jgi:hypothetical protein
MSRLAAALRGPSRPQRFLAAMGALGALALSAAGCASHPAKVSQPSPPAPSPSAAPLQLPAAESGVLPWSLPNPISREVLLPGPGAGQLTILGGLEAGGGSASGVFTLNTSNGALTGSGALLGPLHDAAGVVLAGQPLVFGGGVVASSATVQRLPTALGAASQAGTLPQARSDSAAVAIGATAYVIGGYDGGSFDPAVLATTDGSTFRTVAQLPVPVRYPAVAALDGLIYVFGGQTADGEPTAAVQQIDPATGAVRVVGSLPEPLTGASAATLAGTVYVAGGETSAVGGPAPNGSIWAFDPQSDQLLAAGQLRVPVSHAAIAVLGQRAWLVGGESAQGPVSAVQMLIPNTGFGIAGEAGAGSPYFGGNLLIADAGANRILLLNPEGQVTWTYPNPTAPPPAGGFFYPDDAFFANQGTSIIMNMESYQEIVKIAYPSGKVLWTYGHPGVAGSAPGYLNTPDDAYQLKSGQVSVADIANCRILIINPNGSVASQIGTTRSCGHLPPTHLGSPNGDTPLPNGNLLISEINGGWVSEYTPSGHLVWTARLNLTYPSDPQQIGPDTYLIAGYTNPGVILEFNSQGQTLYRYQVSSGPGALNHPSLVELLPSGVFILNDDHNDRMIAIDPATGASVWQYGVRGVPGTAPGYLVDPDGFDVLMPGGVTPTHTGTG